MSPLHKMRLLFLLGMLAGIGTASTLVLSALQENINLFYTPTQIASGEAPLNTRLRAGGVLQGSCRVSRVFKLLFSVPAAPFPG